MTKETLAFGGNNTAGAIPASPALNANRGCHNPGDFEAGALLVEPVAGTLMCGGKTAGSATTQDAENGLLVTVAPHGLPEVVGALPTHHTPNGHGCAGVNNQAVNAGHIIPEIHPLAAQGHAPAIAFPERLSGTQCVKAAEVCPALGALNPTAVAFQPRIARNGRGDMGDLVNALNAHSGTTGKGDAAPCVAYAIHENQRAELTMNDTVGTLNKGGGKPGQGYPAVAYTLHGTREGTQAVATPTDTAGTIREGTGSAVQNSSNTLALSPSPSLPVSSSDSAWRVRRLTPEECELLQGFPIGYTLIPGKHRLRKGDDLRDSMDYLTALGFQPEEVTALAHSPDGPRYKALGNSWAVPCARWIMARITTALDALAAPSACAKPLLSD